jgi:hypothetical protein
MKRLPKEIYDQLEVKERQQMKKEIKPIFDKGQVVLRLPTAFNPELNITEKDCFEATLLDNDPQGFCLRIIRCKKHE